MKQVAVQAKFDNSLMRIGLGDLYQPTSKANKPVIQSSEVIRAHAQRERV